jgi:hypothetical protein
MPSINIYVTENILRVRVPYPPEVVGNLLEFAQILWQICMNIEFCPVWLIGVTYFNNHNLMFLFFFVLKIIDCAKVAQRYYFFLEYTRKSTKSQNCNIKSTMQ